jgi:hypothetical protein
MTLPSSILAPIPKSPGVYAMYAREGRQAYVSYVGVTEDLRSRIKQHLILRDSSVTTGTSAVSLNAALITQVTWWAHTGFSERAALDGTELVAFDILKPVLRSRGGIRPAAYGLSNDAEFRTEITALVQGKPTGSIRLPTLQQALDRIASLEARVAKLERQIAG